MTMVLRAGSAAALLLFALQAAPAAAQQGSPVVTAPATTLRTSLKIKAGTQVRLVVVREVTSASAGPKQLVELRVDSPVKVAGEVAIPVGTAAWGRVVAANPSADLGTDPMIAMELNQIDLGETAIPIQGKQVNQGELTMSGRRFTLHWNDAKVKAGEIVYGTLIADAEVALPVPSPPADPMLLVRPAPSGKRKKNNLEGPFIIVNRDVGVPVFPYDFPNVPFTVLGEISVGVREANNYAPAPSQKKVYDELWERGAKMGADAVVNARYADPEMSVFAAKKTDATGTAIRFDIPVASATAQQDSDAASGD